MIGWGVTASCNMKCSFCYSKGVRKDHKDLNLDVLMSFIDRNAESIDSVNYGTGENTLSENWFHLLQYVNQRYPAIRQALTTNGSLSQINESKWSSVMSALDEVDISFDFRDESSHNNFRGHSMASSWAVKTLEMCRNYNITTTLVIMGIEETLDLENLDGIFALAKQYNAFVRINIYRPNNSDNLSILSYHTLHKSIKHIINNYKVVSMADPLFSAIVMGKEKVDASGRTSLRILPDGSITTSTYLTEPEWVRANIADANIGSPDFIQNMQKGLSRPVYPPECENCPVKSLCGGGAIDRRILWYGTLLERDPYCPFRNGERPSDWSVNIPYTQGRGPQIHDGYLPTLIFSP